MAGWLEDFFTISFGIIPSIDSSFEINLKNGYGMKWYAPKDFVIDDRIMLPPGQPCSIPNCDVCLN